MSELYALARLPLVPRVLLKLTERFQRPSRKKVEKGSVALRHWSVEF